MKTQDALEYVQDFLDEHNGSATKRELAEFIIWAYDQGWQEGIADYREEQDPTEQQEWRRTR